MSAMPWLALAGGGLGLMQGLEQQKAAEAKRQMDIAQMRISGFTGKQPEYTSMPGLLGPTLAGAKTGAQFAIDNKGMFSGSGKGLDAAQTEALDQTAADTTAAVDSYQMPEVGKMQKPGEYSLYGKKPVDMNKPFQEAAPFDEAPGRVDASYGMRPNSPWQKLMY